MINSWFFIIFRGFFINKIIGFGGYASFPMLFWCAVFYKKIYIHEQNACVGAVNELFIPFATKIFTAFPIDTKIPNIHYSGMPLSHALEMQSAIRPNFSQQKINILIISGSSGGTESINSIVPAIILFAKRHKNLIHIYHQINESEAEVVRNKYHEHEISATVEPFFENIYELLPQINLCISRSGAGSIIDLLSFGITTIFVPLKNSARNHQMKNASWIVSNNIGFLYKPWESNVYNFAALISFAISSPQKIQHSLKAQGIIKKNARAVMYNSMWN